MMNSCYLYMKKCGNGLLNLSARFRVEELIKVKGKVFYGQEPPSGEYTTTESGFNYQLLTVIYSSSPMGCFTQWLQITRLAALREPRSCDLRNTRPTHCLCCHSGIIDRVNLTHVAKPINFLHYLTGHL